jgi:hypothetical protein
MASKIKSSDMRVLLGPHCATMTPSRYFSTAVSCAAQAGVPLFLLGVAVV